MKFKNWLVKNRKTVKILIGVLLFIVILVLVITKTIKLSNEKVDNTITYTCDALKQKRLEYENLSLEDKIWADVNIIGSPNYDKDYSKISYWQSDSDLLKMVLDRIDFALYSTSCDSEATTFYVDIKDLNAATEDFFHVEGSFDLPNILEYNKLYSGNSCAYWTYNQELVRLERGNNNCNGDASVNSTYTYKANKKFVESTSNYVASYQLLYYTKDNDTTYNIWLDAASKIKLTTITSTQENLNSKLDEYASTIKDKLITYVYTFNKHIGGYNFLKYEINYNDKTSYCHAYDQERYIYNNLKSYKDKIFRDIELIGRPSNTITNFKDYLTTNSATMLKMVTDRLDFALYNVNCDNTTYYINRTDVNAAAKNLFGFDISFDLKDVGTKINIQDGDSCASWNYNASLDRLERGDNGCGGEWFGGGDININQQFIETDSNYVVSYQLITMTDEEMNYSYKFWNGTEQIGSLDLSKETDELVRSNKVYEYAMTFTDKLPTYKYTFMKNGNSYYLDKYEIIK